ncbi:circadian clock protein KaiB [Dyadobacter luteus]|jgi:circadian clock protein KaiB|uniref:Circadian clock protein KaiB n=1 Tax=Dyadobacter luteus TaxID=2259619 RepID=A0A3D8Y3J4_9BACT|nr:circadian clock KaiB family protein [Dyadobacter luteus]REA55182.1 circadian clock protein KaiB [Dyadobacter luteus]
MSQGSLSDTYAGHNHEGDESFVLRLYVAGASPNSIRAISNIREICEKHLEGNYKLQIIDVHQDKALASREQLLALPMLIKSSPYPEKKMIGDMSDTAKVLHSLGIIDPV